MKKPSGYCECGCGGKTAIADKNHAVNGYVKGWPRRFIDNHHRQFSPHEYLVDEKTGCWIWQRSIRPSGYGQLWRNGKCYMAHRWYYEQEHGPIQNGLELDHLCHNRDANCPGNECIHRRCVNPLHLEAVAHPENVRRGRASKLNPVLVAQIRSLCSQGWLQKDIAPAFGVAQGTVSKIATGRAWQEG